MKRGWVDLLLAVLLGIVVPWVLCALRIDVIQQEEAKEEIHITVSRPEQMRIPVLTDTGLQEMPLTEYLTGVLLGEVPDSFAQEAKKAQAVVARTYALRVAAGNRHGGAVCTDSGCCQNYRDPAAVEDTEAVAKARTAVEQTEGLVLTYEGALIDATYFSCSGGMTEDAVAVWGSDIPYLQSVESPGEEYATHYTDAVTFTLEVFQETLGAELAGDAEQWFGAVTYTDGGGVEFIEIGGEAYAGTQLRKLLGLRSTVFEITLQEDAIVITTKGYGHRVGMSQYGADAMARAGSDFAQILYHYYSGVELTEDWG